jgi:hypothetical protein
MAQDKRDLLKVLEGELEFLDEAGYDKFLDAAETRPTLIFQDSPSCPNRNDPKHSIPCSECVLMPLVPAHRHNEKVPCRYIPLNDVGETVDTLYRWGTLEDAKLVLGNWLMRMITKMKQKRLRFRPDRMHAGPGFHIPDGT